MEREEQQKLIDWDKHAELLKIGKKLELGTCHKLEPVIIQGIIQTFEFLGASDGHINQMAFDLAKARYKIFDWLGMMYTGRCVNGRMEDRNVFNVVEKMVEHYIAMKHVGGWAWSYRGHIDLDYELRTENDKNSANGKHCQDCIDSYEHWHNQTEEEREKEQKEMYGDNVINIS